MSRYAKVRRMHLREKVSINEIARRLVAYPGEGHEMLFDAHTRCLIGLGGVAQRGIYDNMKTAVDKVSKGKERIVNARWYSKDWRSRP